ncbi:hypothetical protein GGR95_003554 [Sulfitobacter undariae]|uniref:Uncharacterized protein n=1 Tax=Sulfitobacter undariae TaxID=1563671 RepID=A0A7W6E706_9RHOB|nr:hypothetical protein [Sulfitobacter undariae]MBB3995888.1 hypothetical protein [Sulfitobacter undariae]
MIINFLPTRSDQPLSLERKGSLLILNGIEIALEEYVAGDTPAIIDQPVHDGSQWHVTLVLPHGMNAAEETLFPAPITLAGDGIVPLPPYEVPCEEEMV